MKDTHCNVVFLNAPNGAFDFLVEKMGKVCKCCDEVTNCIIIAELSVFIVLLCIEFSRNSGSLKLAFQD